MLLNYKYLMFIPCIIRRSRKNQQYALICTTPLFFYVLGPTCFGSDLPSSGSVVDPFELLEIQIEWVVYHIMCGYVTGVPDCRFYLRNHGNLAHGSRNHTLYDKPLIRFVLQVTQKGLRRSLMIADRCRNM
jgi:hypothetical protein